MDFEKMILEAMKHGKTIEEVMKDISAAANKIEMDRAATKYDRFNHPVVLSFHSGKAADDAILFTERMTPLTVATVLTHFMCQNVPGYAETLAKTGADPIDVYQKMLKSQISIAKAFTKVHSGKDDNEDLSLGCLLNELFNSLIDTPSKDKSTEVPTKSTPSKSKPVTSSTKVQMKTSDEELLSKFFRDFSL